VATILELKSTIAGILGVTVNDFTVNGIDFGLTALNAVRLQAEQGNDFEFQRKTLSLSVNTLTGGSLENAVIQGTSTTATIKTLIDVGQADTNGNFVPLEWTTRAESHERTRGENRYGSRSLRYPSDADAQVFVGGRRRVMLDNDRVSLFPMGTVSENVTVLLDCYVYSSDWTSTSNTLTVTGGTGVTGVNTTYYKYGNTIGGAFYLSINPTAIVLSAGPATYYSISYDWLNGRWVIADVNQTLLVFSPNRHALVTSSQSPAGTYTGAGTFTGTAVVTLATTDPTSDIWTTKGANYLIWASVVWLNQNASVFGKQFVNRQEGNLAPPTVLRDEALATLIACDTNKFELFRRHGR
jgi:hypothetical protein